MKAWCSCGTVLHGGFGSHKAMHVRRGDWEPSASKRSANPNMHGFIPLEEYLQRFPDRNKFGMRKETA